MAGAALMYRLGAQGAIVIEWLTGLLIWLAIAIPREAISVNPNNPPQVIPYDVYHAALINFGSEVNDALCIARHESQFKNRTGAAGEIGYWQIHPIHGIPAEALRNPYVNAAIAKVLHDKAGDWSPWLHAAALCGI